MQHSMLDKTSNLIRPSARRSKIPNGSVPYDVAGCEILWRIRVLDFSVCTKTFFTRKIAFEANWVPMLRESEGGWMCTQTYLRARLRKNGQTLSWILTLSRCSIYMCVHGRAKLAFAFVERLLVRAIQAGLASPETLENPRLMK